MIQPKSKGTEKWPSVFQISLKSMKSVSRLSKTKNNYETEKNAYIKCMWRELTQIFPNIVKRREAQLRVCQKNTNKKLKVARSLSS